MIFLLIDVWFKGIFENLDPGLLQAAGNPGGPSSRWEKSKPVIKSCSTNLCPDEEQKLLNILIRRVRNISVRSAETEQNQTMKEQINTGGHVYKGRENYTHTRSLHGVYGSLGQHPDEKSLC